MKSPKDLFAIKPSLLSFLSPPFSYMSREIAGVPVMLNSKASSLFCWFGEIGDVLWNVCEFNVLECKLPPVWCYLSPSGLQALGVLCIMQMGQEWVRDAQHSDQKPFASLPLVCVCPASSREVGTACSYRKTRRVPFSIKYSHSEDQPD